MNWPLSAQDGCQHRLAINLRPTIFKEMTLSLRAIGITFLFIGVFSLPVKATSLNFNFSFYGSSGYAGTVAGQIIGLQDNATSLPYEVIITSDPANTPSITFGPGGLSGGLTVTNGAITGGGLVATIGGTTYFRINSPLKLSLRWRI